MLMRVPWRRAIATLVMLGLGGGCSLLAANAGADSSSTPAVQLHLDTLQNTSTSGDGTTPTGTTPDSSPNHLDATASGTPITGGRFQGALDMGYSDNGVTVPDNTALRPTAGVTVMAWVRDSVNPGANKMILGKAFADGCNRLAYGLITGPTGGLEFDATTYNDGDVESATSESSASALWDGNWHAVAGTYDGTTMRLWIDGTLAKSLAVTPAPEPLDYNTSVDSPVATGLYAGQPTPPPSAGCDYSNYRYGGRIDEIRVYNRPLSQTELQYLQSSSHTTPPDLPPPTTTTTTTTPPPPPKPSAQFLPIRQVALPGATGFNGLLSRPSPGGQITDYHWTILNAATPTVDTDCGTSPVLGHPFPANGVYHVTLTVTDTFGRHASATAPVTITGRTLLNAVNDPRTFDCENPAKGEQPSRADCIKTYGFGILDVNSRGKLDDCFVMSQSRPSPTAKWVDQGTIGGPVAINGLYVPIPESVKTNYDSNGNVSVHGADLFSVRVGTFLTEKFPLQFTVKPNSQGVFHLVKIDPAVDTPKFLGSLPISGSFSIDLTYHQSHVTVGMGLPSPFSFGAKRDASGTVTLISDNVNGLHYDGLGLSVPDLWLGPLYVSNLSFSYTKSDDTWNGTAKVLLPGSTTAIDASGPPTQPPDFGVHIVHGKFHGAGFGVDFTPPTQPDLFPPFHTVLLNSIGASVGLNPFRLTGQIVISAANLVDENGVLLAVFASPSSKYTMPENVDPELAPLAGRTFDRFTLAIGGTASLKVPLISGFDLPLLNAYGLYEFPDYFEFYGGFKFGIAFVSLTGNVSGFVYPSSGKFNAQAQVQGCLRNIKIDVKIFSIKLSPCLNVGAVVSTKGIGFCTVLPVPTPIGTIPVEVGIGYHWGDSSPDFMVFSCDTKPYAEVSPLAARAAANSYAVRLPAGLPSAMFRVRGAGAAPQLSVTDPHGHNITGSANAIVLQGTDPTTTLVGLRHPLAGRWTITAAPGSAPITDVAVAQGLPALKVRGSVTGRGSRRVLHYRISALDGRQVSFVEHGRGVARVIGVARQATGKIAFSPQSGAPKRSIVALVEGANGPGRQIAVTTFRAPGFTRLARPHKLHVRRSHGKIIITWSRVAGAARYEVLLRLSDRSQVFRVVRRAGAVLVDPFPARRGTVLVDALDASGQRGPARTVRITAVRAKRH
jgi:hypothetical protein